MGLIDLLAGEQEDLKELLGWFLQAEDAPTLDEAQLQVIARVTDQINTPTVASPAPRVWLIVFDYEDGECGHAIVRGDKEKANNTAKMLAEIHGGPSDTRVADVTDGDDFDDTLEEWMDMQIQDDDVGAERE